MVSLDPFLLAEDIWDPPAWEPAGGGELYPHQVPPDGAGDTYRLFLIEGARASGKSYACSMYLARYMRENPGTRGRIIAPTFGDAVESCIRGPSGLLRIDPDIDWCPSAPGGAKVIWPNGSEALVLGTPTLRDVDRLRAGGNRGLDHWEEMAANPMLAEAWDQAQLGLRLGDRPHSIASTTPRPTKAYKAIRALPGVVLRHATMSMNRSLPAEFVAQMRARYAGTRLGRQELDGELLEDVEGALVNRDQVEQAREPGVDAGQVHQRTIGIDTGGPGAQALTMACRTADGMIHVERSELYEGSATDFLRHAVRLGQEHGACLIVEKNHGGDYLLGLLQQVMQEVGVIVPTRPVWASSGKRARAEPVGLLIEQGRVAWPAREEYQMAELVDEWCSWDPSSKESPHLLDSACWAIAALMGVVSVGHEADLAAIPYG